MRDLVIKNGTVVTSHGIIYGGVAVEGREIVCVDCNSRLGAAQRVIDAQGNFVIPGLIDPHVHLAGGSWPSLREGLEAQFTKETEGALHGGVTTCGHFLSAIKGTSLLSSLDTVIEIGERLSWIDFFCHACIVDENHIAEQPQLYDRGTTSFKHFFNPYKGLEGAEMGKFAPCDEGMLFRSFKSIATLGYPALAMCHCEEMDIIYQLQERLKKAGRNDLLSWTESRPNFVEAMRIHHAIYIAKATNCPLYIVHISSEEGAKLVAQSRQEGLRIFGETCPHYLTHTGYMEQEIGCWGKVNPSLKYPQDNEALWRHIQTGGVTNLATDHGACDLLQKEQGGGKHNNIWDSRPAICGGMEHLLPVMMSAAKAGRITIEDIVRLCCTNNAKVFGIYPRKGVLAPGSDADIVIVDPDKETVVDDKFYHCQCEYPIYYGWRMKGMARTAIVRGKIMMEDYETVGEFGHGRYVPCRAS
jgi:dihydropyrimidinase